jgi:hypothetical protein
MEDDPSKPGTTGLTGEASLAEIAERPSGFGAVLIRTATPDNGASRSVMTSAGIGVERLLFLSRAIRGTVGRCSTKVFLSPECSDRIHLRCSQRLL